MPSDAYERIWNAVAKIPYGKVANYGQIARVAGLGRRARLVGYALHSTPDDMTLPWHRVINAQGRVSPRAEPGWEGFQRHLLEEEGVVFTTRGVVDLKRYRWDEVRA